MRLTINKPAGDVFFSTARYLRFVFSDSKVFIVPQNKNDGASVAVEARQIGGFTVEIGGDIENKIIKTLRPSPEHPLYILRHGKIGFQLINVTEKLARHIPCVRIWVEVVKPVIEKSDVGLDLNLDPSELWTFYLNIRDMTTRVVTAGRPSNEDVAAGKLMAVFERIGMDTARLRKNRRS